MHRQTAAFPPSAPRSVAMFARNDINPLEDGDGLGNCDAAENVEQYNAAGRFPSLRHWRRWPSIRRCAMPPAKVSAVLDGLLKTTSGVQCAAGNHACQHLRFELRERLPKPMPLSTSPLRRR